MSLLVRFEPIAERHRPETVKQRPASRHWRGRAFDGRKKMHIACLTDPVLPEQVGPFLKLAEAVLKQMGGSEPEIRLALRHAEGFLREHLMVVVQRVQRTPPPPPDTRVGDWARAIVERHRRGQT